jgi:hypothetical protein
VEVRSNSEMRTHTGINGISITVTKDNVLTYVDHSLVRRKMRVGDNVLTYVDHSLVRRKMRVGSQL